MTYEFKTGNEHYGWLNAVIGVDLVQEGEQDLTAEVCALVAMYGIVLKPRLDSFLINDFFHPKNSCTIAE
jgi:hypothetical protein